MSESIEPETGEMIVKRVSVPIGLEELMEGLTKEVLLKKPDDIYVFAAEYFSRLLVLREKGSYKVKMHRNARSVAKQTTKQPPEKLVIRGASKHLSRQFSIRGESPVKVVAPMKRPPARIGREDKSTDRNKFIDRRKIQKAEGKKIEAKPIQVTTPRPGLESTENASKKRDRSLSSNRRGASTNRSMQKTPRQKSVSSARKEESAPASSNTKKELPVVSSIEESQEFVKDGKLAVTPPKIIKRPQAPDGKEVVTSLIVPQLSSSVTEDGENNINATTDGANNIADDIVTEEEQDSNKKKENKSTGEKNLIDTIDNKLNDIEEQKVVEDKTMFQPESNREGKKESAEIKKLDKHKDVVIESQEDKVVDKDMEDNPLEFNKREKSAISSNENKAVKHEDEKLSSEKSVVESASRSSTQIETKVFEDLKDIKHLSKPQSRTETEEKNDGETILENLKEIDLNNGIKEVEALKALESLDKFDPKTKPAVEDEREILENEQLEKNLRNEDETSKHRKDAENLNENDSKVKSKFKDEKEGSNLQNADKSSQDPKALENLKKSESTSKAEFEDKKESLENALENNSRVKNLNKSETKAKLDNEDTEQTNKTAQDLKVSENIKESELKPKPESKVEKGTQNVLENKTPNEVRTSEDLKNTENFNKSDSKTKTELEKEILENVLATNLQEKDKTSEDKEAVEYLNNSDAPPNVEPKDKEDVLEKGLEASSENKDKTTEDRQDIKNVSEGKSKNEQKNFGDTKDIENHDKYDSKTKPENEGNEQTTKTAEGPKNIKKTESKTKPVSKVEKETQKGLESNSQIEFRTSEDRKCTENFNKTDSMVKPEIKDEKNILENVLVNNLRKEGKTPEDKKAAANLNQPDPKPKLVFKDKEEILEYENLSQNKDNIYDIQKDIENIAKYDLRTKPENEGIEQINKTTENIQTSDSKTKPEPEIEKGTQNLLENKLPNEDKTTAARKDTDSFNKPESKATPESKDENEILKNVLKNNLQKEDTTSEEIKSDENFIKYDSNLKIEPKEEKEVLERIIENKSQNEDKPSEDRKDFENFNKSDSKTKSENGDKEHRSQIVEDLKPPRNINKSESKTKPAPKVETKILQNVLENKSQNKEKTSETKTDTESLNKPETKPEFKDERQILENNLKKERETFKDEKAAEHLNQPDSKPKTEPKDKKEDLENSLGNNSENRDTISEDQEDIESFNQPELNVKPELKDENEILGNVLENNGQTGDKISEDKKAVEYLNKSDSKTKPENEDNEQRSKAVEDLKAPEDINKSESKTKTEPKGEKEILQNVLENNLRNENKSTEDRKNIEKRNKSDSKTPENEDNKQRSKTVEGLKAPEDINKSESETKPEPKGEKEILQNVLENNLRNEDKSTEVRKDIEKRNKSDSKTKPENEDNEQRSKTVEDLKAPEDINKSESKTKPEPKGEKEILQNVLENNLRNEDKSTEVRNDIQKRNKSDSKTPENEDNKQRSKTVEGLKAPEDINKSESETIPEPKGEKETLQNVLENNLRNEDKSIEVRKDIEKGNKSDSKTPENEDNKQRSKTVEGLKAPEDINKSESETKPEPKGEKEILQNVLENNLRNEDKSTEVRKDIEKGNKSDSKTPENEDNKQRSKTVEGLKAPEDINKSESETKLEPKGEKEILQNVLENNLRNEDKSTEVRNDIEKRNKSDSKTPENEDNKQISKTVEGLKAPEDINKSESETILEPKGEKEILQNVLENNLQNEDKSSEDRMDIEKRNKSDSRTKSENEDNEKRSKTVEDLKVLENTNQFESETKPERKGEKEILQNVLENNLRNENESSEDQKDTESINKPDSKGKPKFKDEKEILENVLENNSQNKDKASEDRKEIKNLNKSDLQARPENEDNAQRSKTVEDRTSENQKVVKALNKSVSKTKTEDDSSGKTIMTNLKDDTKSTEDLKELKNLNQHDLNTKPEDKKVDTILENEVQENSGIVTKISENLKPVESLSKTEPEIKNDEEISEMVLDKNLQSEIRTDKHLKALENHNKLESKSTPPNEDGKVILENATESISQNKTKTSDDLKLQSDSKIKLELENETKTSENIKDLENLEKSDSKTEPEIEENVIKEQKQEVTKTKPEYKNEEEILENVEENNSKTVTKPQDPKIVKDFNQSDLRSKPDGKSAEVESTLSENVKTLSKSDSKTKFEHKNNTKISEDVGKNHIGNKTKTHEDSQSKDVDLKPKGNIMENLKLENKNLIDKDSKNTRVNDDRDESKNNISNKETSLNTGVIKEKEVDNINETILKPANVDLQNDNKVIDNFEEANSKSKAAIEDNDKDNKADKQNNFNIYEINKNNDFNINKTHESSSQEFTDSDINFENDKVEMKKSDKQTNNKITKEGQELQSKNDTLIHSIDNVNHKSSKNEGSKTEIQFEEKHSVDHQQEEIDRNVTGEVNYVDPNKMGENQNLVHKHSNKAGIVEIEDVTEAKPNTNNLKSSIDGHIFGDKKIPLETKSNEEDTSEKDKKTDRKKRDENFKVPQTTVDKTEEIKENLKEYTNGGLVDSKEDNILKPDSKYTETDNVPVQMKDSTFGIEKTERQSLSSLESTPHSNSGAQSQVSALDKTDISSIIKSSTQHFEDSDISNQEGLCKSESQIKTDASSNSKTSSTNDTDMSSSSLTKSIIDEQFDTESEKEQKQRFKVSDVGHEEPVEEIATNDGDKTVQTLSVTKKTNNDETLDSHENKDVGIINKVTSIVAGGLLDEKVKSYIGDFIHSEKQHIFVSPITTGRLDLAKETDTKLIEKDLHKEKLANMSMVQTGNSNKQKQNEDKLKNSNNLDTPNLTPATEESFEKESESVTNESDVSVKYNTVKEDVIDFLNNEKKNTYKPSGQKEEKLEENFTPKTKPPLGVRNRKVDSLKEKKSGSLRQTNDEKKIRRVQSVGVISNEKLKPQNKSRIPTADFRYRTNKNDRIKRSKSQSENLKIPLDPKTVIEKRVSESAKKSQIAGENTKLEEKSADGVGKNREEENSKKSSVDKIMEPDLDISKHEVKQVKLQKRNISTDEISIKQIVAATKIQALWKGFQVRKSEKRTSDQESIKELKESGLARVKMSEKENEFVERKRSLPDLEDTTIKSPNKDTVKEGLVTFDKEKDYKLEKAAVIIQKIWKGFTVRKNHRNKGNTDTLVKTSIIPNTLLIEDKKDDHLRQKRDLQHEQAQVTNKFENMNDKRFRDAVLLIQKVWRGFRVRKELKKFPKQYNNIRKEENKSAVVADTKKDSKTEPESNLSESKLSMNKEEFSRAAVLIQKIWRGFRVRKIKRVKKDSESEEVEEKPVDEIQKKLTTNNENSEDKFAKSAILIQKLWRGFKVRKDLKRQFKPKENCSIKEDEVVAREDTLIKTVNKQIDSPLPKNSSIEKQSKSISETSKQLEQTKDMAEFARAATLIQKIWRGFKVRKLLKNDKESTNQSQLVTKVQVQADESEEKFVKAAVLIQKIWRGFKVRKIKREKKLFGKRIEEEKPVVEDIKDIDPKDKKSALKIQSLWRGYQVRKNISVIKNKLEDVISTNDDGTGKELTDGDILNAATKIQAGVRGYLLRKKYKTNIGNLNSISEEDAKLIQDEGNLQKSEPTMSERKLSDEEVAKALTFLNKLEVPNDVPVLYETKHPKFYRSQTVEEPDTIRKHYPPLTKLVSENITNVSSKDDNNNNSTRDRDSTALKEEVKKLTDDGAGGRDNLNTKIEDGTKANANEVKIQTKCEENIDLPTTSNSEDDTANEISGLNHSFDRPLSIDSNDSIVTVISKDVPEGGKDREKDEILEREHLISDFQNQLLDQISGKSNSNEHPISKFDIEQLRSELKETGLFYYPEDAMFLRHENSKETDDHDELLEYLDGLELPAERAIENFKNNSLNSSRDLPDIKEDVEEISSKDVQKNVPQNNGSKGESDLDIEKIKSTLRDCEDIAREINMGFETIKSIENEKTNDARMFCGTLEKSIVSHPIPDDVEVLQPVDTDKKSASANFSGNNEVVGYTGSSEQGSSNLNCTEKTVSDNQLLHTGELHDSIVLPLDKNSGPQSNNSHYPEEVAKKLTSENDTENSKSKLLHTGELHDSIVLSLAENLKNDEEKTANVVPLSKSTPKFNYGCQIPSTGDLGKTHLLHTGELHDTIVIPLLNAQQLNKGKVESTDASSETKLVSKPEPAPSTRLLHTGELHDSVTVPLFKTASTGTSETSHQESGDPEVMETIPRQVDSGSQTNTDASIAVQLEEAAAGDEALTPQRSDVSGVADRSAQTPDKGALPIENGSPDFSSAAPTDSQSMESGKPTKATDNNKSMESEAATKIQAGFRGYQVRKQLKLKNGSSDINNQRRQLRRKSSGRITENNRNPQDKQKTPSEVEEKSAVKIQAGVRGFLVRRRQKKQKNQD